MFGTALFAAAFVVTNAPSLFSTMVERTAACPVVTEPKVGVKFVLNLPQDPDCRIEFAVGRDTDRDGSLADEESPIALTCSRNLLEVRGANGQVKASAEYTPSNEPLSFVLKPGKRSEPHVWQLIQSGQNPTASGSLDCNMSISDFNLVRVRVSGPTASALVIDSKREYDVLVLTIR